MQFSKVIGKVQSSLVKQAEEKLTRAFMDLAGSQRSKMLGSKMGGDPFIFSLVCTAQHICTESIPTAATDGRFFYWNPKFAIKHSLIGLRMIIAHEAWHAIYMHPSRRGSRLPKLWNIAVDYIVNGMIMDDLKTRQLDAKSVFNSNLGAFVTLEGYANMIKNPFARSAELPNLDPTDVVPKDNSVVLPKANDERELTPEQIEEIEKRAKNVKFFFADPDLSDEMRRPEKIYEYLYNLLPKCPECGSIGKYSPPKDKKDKGKESGKGNKGDKGNEPGEADNGDQGSGDSSHSHGNGPSCDCKDHGGCGTCGGDIDIFDLGGTLDDHMDTNETEENIAKRIANAMRTAKEMAGHVPAGLEDELGALTAPKVVWQDAVRGKITRIKAGGGRNDWNNFKSRSLFYGHMAPKRKSYVVTFGCLLDTSGSMSQDDMAYGISQLQSLDQRSEGTITFADSEIYWDDSIKVDKCDSTTLKEIKPIGRGGTIWAPYFEEYEKKIGKCDFLIILTDGYLDMQDVANMKNPGIDVFWIITSGYAEFTPPFGKVMPIR